MKKELEPSLDKDEPLLDKDGYAGNEIGLQDLWRIIASGKKIIAVTIVFFITLAILAIIFLDSKYTAYVTLYPSANGESASGVSSLAKSFGGVAGLAGISLGGTDKIEKSMSIFNSRVVISDFIEQNNLLPELFRNNWNAKLSNWRKAHGLYLYYLKIRYLMSGKSGKFDARLVPTMQEGIREFLKHMALVENKKTGIVTLSIVWGNPRFAAKIANSFVAYGNKYIQERTIKLSARKQRFLNDQLKKNSTKEVKDLIYKLVEKEIAAQMYANVHEDYAFQVIDPALIPEVRTSPRVGLMLGMSLFLGLVIGILSVLLNYFFISNNENQ